MNTTFEIKQSYNSEDIWIKLTSQLPSDSVITKYTINYNVYDPNSTANSIVYSYDLDDALDISIVTSGLYVPINNFTSSDNSSLPEILTDGIYSFNIDTLYSLTDNPSEELIVSYNGLECLYQNILNAYNQVHLNYNWTQRYREDNSKLLQIAEELTWIDGLTKSCEIGKLDEFSSILGHLNNYFTVTYDY